MSNDFYHHTRLQPDPRRRVLWQTLVASVFQKQIAPEATVLELGAGYGDFINAVEAQGRIAVDCWEGMTEFLAPGVKGVVTHISHLESIVDNTIDYVFASNCFEHVSRQDLLDCLAQLRDKMKPGATLTIIQPNFKYCVREYFDDYTHASIYTHSGLCDLLVANGFRIIQCQPRFLPLTLRSGFPVHPLLIRLYLASPFKPFAKQMLIRATR